MQAKFFWLVLACDLSDDGSELGPVTITRCQKALEHISEYGGEIVVAAGFSPRPQHANQPKAMSAMMADWFDQHMVRVEVLEADRFNTRGELQEFSDFLGKNAWCHVGIISGASHLDRAKILLEKIDDVLAMRVELIPSQQGKSMTLRGRRLETIKIQYAKLPLVVQDTVTFLLHKTPLRWLQLSY